jgi:hypothetical protein
LNRRHFSYRRSKEKFDRRLPEASLVTPPGQPVTYGPCFRCLPVQTQPKSSSFLN